MRYFYKLLSLCIMFSSCHFLDEESQNMAYVENVTDLKELLLGECYIQTDPDFKVEALVPTQLGIMSKTSAQYVWIHLMDDDVDALYGNYNNATAITAFPLFAGLHCFSWQENPYLDNENKELPEGNWTSMYHRIAVLNTILYQLNEMDIDKDELLLARQVKGEALYLRAAYYFWMVNLYARPYSRLTASQDLGIPLKINSDVEDKFFSRNTIQEVYSQIVSDLKEAISSLKGIDVGTIYRVNLAAAYTLLSRVYLYMEEYETCIAMADSALLQPGYRLEDLNNYVDGNSFLTGQSLEVFFSQGSYIMGLLHTNDNFLGAWSGPFAASCRVSDELLALYDDQDLRPNAFFVTCTNNKTAKRGLKLRYDKDEKISDIWTVRLAEVYLNKAEAEAQLGRGDAINTIKLLLDKRMIPGYQVNIPGGGADLVNFIRTERRKELCFEAHRWFDLRRYAVNEKVPLEKEIRHSAYEFTSTNPTLGGGVWTKCGYYLLKSYLQEPTSWIMPIPQDAIEFNEGALLNEKRSDRDVIVE